MKNISLKRYIYNAEHGDDSVRNVIGDMLIDGDWFAYTLEDEIRADGDKVYGKTAIPSGDDYFVTLTFSSRWQKLMPLIYNRKRVTKNGSIEYWVEGVNEKTGDVVKWFGVRFHGGNTEKDTLGCPLTCANTDGKKIWGCKGKNDELIKMLTVGVHIPLSIENVPFSYKGKFSK